MNKLTLNNGSNLYICISSKKVYGPHPVTTNRYFNFLMTISNCHLGGCLLPTQGGSSRLPCMFITPTAAVKAWEALAEWHISVRAKFQRYCDGEDTWFSNFTAQFIYILFCEKHPQTVSPQRSPKTSLFHWPYVTSNEILFEHSALIQKKISQS